MLVKAFKLIVMFVNVLFQVFYFLLMKDLSFFLLLVIELIERHAALQLERHKCLKLMYARESDKFMTERSAAILIRIYASNLRL